MNIDSFDWDDGNLAKCQKHGLLKAEVEQFFTDGNYSVFEDALHSTTEQRFLAIGRLEDRHLFAAFTLRLSGLSLAIRPISVRPMHEKEILHYEQQARKIADAGK